MTTYIYETFPTRPGEKPKYFEIKQDGIDLPLFTHPETGEQIRQVLLGGAPVVKKSNPDTSGGACCGPSGCC